jgi:exosortase H (IPTLxxWG-CTERM-specific)
MIRFLLLFVLIMGVLFGAQLTPWGQTHFVEPWTTSLATICQKIVAAFDPNVTAVGKILRSTTNGFAVSIEAGCNGVEATIVLLAAILAFPAPWKYKLIGFIAGVFAVQGLNIIRVISLFYLGQWSMKWFEWAHLYVWQALIMLDVLIVFLIWIRRVPLEPRAPDGPPPSSGTPTLNAA